MSILTTRIDRASAEYAAASETMTAKLTELDGGEHAKALAGGGDKYVARHHARGKLLPRERIELLLDPPDSPFLELSPPLAAWGTEFPVGASVVTGIGVVEGVECVIVANDPPTVRGGTSNPWTLRKSLRANDIAMQNRLPLISLVESGGADLRPRRKSSFRADGCSATSRACRRPASPTIALVFGNSTAGGAYIPRHVRPRRHDRTALEGLPGRPAAGEDGHR